MAEQYALCLSNDEMSITSLNGEPHFTVKKRGATGALGQLFSRRFVIFDEQGRELFQVINGNSGTYPRASLIVNGREELVLVSGGNCFRTVCNVRDSLYGFQGDPFSKSFEVTYNGEVICHVNVKRGGGKALYSADLTDDAHCIQALSALATLAVFCGRIIPCAEPEEE